MGAGKLQLRRKYLEDTIEKLNYDLFYIKNLSFFMDLMIIFKTVKTVIFRQGAR